MLAYDGDEQNPGKRTGSSIGMGHLGEPGWTYRRAVEVIAPLLLLVLVALTSPACAELELLGGGSGGGAGVPPSGSLSVSFIDVGQGDGVLVQAGGESHLIDAGRPEEGPNVVDFLRSRGVESLEGIVVSNPDADHIGGFLDVFDAFAVETVYVSGDPNTTLTYNTFLRGVREEGAETEVLRAGMILDWGGVRADA
jgi:competence protein ComEC